MGEDSGGQMGYHDANICWGSCVDAQRNYCAIPTVGDRVFFVPTQTHRGKAANSLAAMDGHDRPLFNELLW